MSILADPAGTEDIMRPQIRQNRKMPELIMFFLLLTSVPSIALTIPACQYVPRLGRIRLWHASDWRPSFFVPCQSIWRENMLIRNIAVIGAGISGVTAARILRGQGFRIRIFEKSRGCGGRMATRRSSGYEFDHGAQFFTVRDPVFQEIVEDCMSEKIVEPWLGRFATLNDRQILLETEDIGRYVGVPRMSRVVRYLAAGTSVMFNTKVDRLSRIGGRWQLISEEEALPDCFDAVILAIPPDQAAAVLGSEQGLFPQLRQTSLLPCWAVMTAFEHPLKLSFDGAWVHNSSLSWIARNSSKPQRQHHECWVLHGTSEWSREEFDQDPKWICSHLLSTFFEETEHEILTPSWLSSHRWRYASAASSLSDGSFWDPASRLGICGDWCQGSRVEAAFLSGKGLAEKILVS